MHAKRLIVSLTTLTVHCMGIRMALCVVADITATLPLLCRVHHTEALPGYQFDSTSGSLAQDDNFVPVLCPRGTFGVGMALPTTVAQGNTCEICPDGTTTQSEGSTSPDDCSEYHTSHMLRQQACDCQTQPVPCSELHCIVKDSSA
jgi:Tyrosine-protein kinase ephrin type A/B receptor-like